MNIDDLADAALAERAAAYAEARDYFDDEPTTEYLRIVLDSGPVSTRATDIDLTEPLHDPADEETTNPGLPSHRRLNDEPPQ